MQWRPMLDADLNAVSKLAANIYANLFESDFILQEKLRQFPGGCYILENQGLFAGYVLSHPWLRFNPHPLDTPLGALPENPDTYYIHDLALAVSARGSGMAEEIIEEIVKIARSMNLAFISLVAVGGAEKFWQRQKFEIIAAPDLAKKLISYDTGAFYMERAVI